MKRLYCVVLFSTLLSTFLQAQSTRYHVTLKYKSGSSFTLANPSTYLSQRAIDRRQRYGIAIDSTDLPVNPNFTAQIAAIPNVTILNTSKWLNSISIQTNDANAITAIQAFPFVQTVQGLAAREAVTNRPSKVEPEDEMIPFVPQQQRLTDIQADYFNYGTTSYNEIHLHNGEFLHNIGLRGQTMQISMLDGGFFNYTSLRAFDSVNANGQVLSTWDFVSRNASVTEDNAHGMQCFSTIAANIPGQFIGKAPKASFHLFRTEDVASEYPIEEHNWVCAAERADSLGVDVISSSVGYYDFDNPAYNYPKTAMDGNTTLVVKGADLAAKKGLMVFNSAGNEGNNAWRTIVTPADGDSVVAVGAVNINGAVGSFSSYGPSADGQIKPDMASVGVGALLQGAGNTLFMSNGTSFSCPNMAGLSTCLWQGFPEFNNMKIIRTLQQAANNFSNPNDRTGYGIPDMKKAFGILLIDYATASVNGMGCTATINWTSKDVNAMKYEIERKGPGEPDYSKIGEINPQPGLILATHSYQFDDVLSAPAGTFSYRIRQIIDTAIASFSSVYIDTASFVLASSCVSASTSLLQLNPNPVTGSMATLVIDNPSAIPQLSISLYDGKGSLLRQWKDAKAPGRRTIDLSLGNIPAGKYYLQVFDGNKSIGTVEFIR